MTCRSKKHRVPHHMKKSWWGSSDEGHQLLGKKPKKETSINETKPLETSSFVNVCYYFIVVGLYYPKLSYMILSGSTPRESR